MGNFTNYVRTVTAAIGALVLSTLFVTAAVGPAATASQAGSYAAAQVLVQEQQA